MSPWGHNYISSLLLALLGGLHLSCDRKEAPRDAPPDSSPPPAAPCQDTLTGPIAGLPGKVGAGKAGTFCIDPRVDVRRYGAFASSPLDAACAELFNGECELYKSYGLEGVKTLQYVAEDTRPAKVSVVVSSFRRSTGAFGFFTRRILGEGHPSQVTMKSLATTGRAVTGEGMTVVWRGKEVVELTYISEEETPQEIEANSPGVLHPLAQAIAQELVGPTEPERSVRFLEDAGADPLGILVLVDGILSENGTGPAVLGYFSEAKMPHRVLVAERRDEDGAADLMRLLRRSGVSEKLKDRDIIRLRLTQDSAPPETWYLRRNDETVLLVGPLESAEGLPVKTTPAERKAHLLAWESFATSRLMQLSTRELKFGE